MALMNQILKNKSQEQQNEAKKYIFSREVPELFESVTVGLLHHKPADPVIFVQECIAAASKSRDPIKWNTFLEKPPSKIINKKDEPDDAYSSTSIRAGFAYADPEPDMENIPKIPWPAIISDEMYKVFGLPCHIKEPALPLQERLMQGLAD